MDEDTIIEEIRAIRDTFAKEHGYDIRAIVAALQLEDEQSGAQIVSLAPKRLPVQQAERKAS